MKRLVVGATGALGSDVVADSLARDRDTVVPKGR